MSKRMLKAMLIMIMPAVINLYAEAQVQIDGSSGLQACIRSFGKHQISWLGYDE